MKIAFISHDFPPFGFGGVGTYVFDLALGLKKNGHDVTVFCAEQKGQKKELNVPFKIVRLPMPNLPPHAVWFQLINRKFFRKALNKFDIINLQYTCAAVYLSYNNRRNNTVVTFHSTPKQELVNYLRMPFRQWSFSEFIFNVLEYPLYHLLTKYELKTADIAISVGKALTANIKSDYSNRRKIITIQNSIDTNYIQKESRDLKPKGKTRVIFFGRLYYRKGITFLLDAINLLAKDRTDFKVDIYGEGPLQAYAEKYIKENNIEHIISLHKFLKRELLFKEIAQSHIVLLPSLYEAFSIAYLETMACGKPLIVFDYPFSRELVVNGVNGLLAKKRNAEDLAYKLDMLISKKKLRKQLGNNAKETVMKQFTINKKVGEYIEAYKGIMK